ncbi:MAG: gliding motility lipoprotein GldH [Bacteroidales bacterium]|jgi:gliding motility-associated lipoprotein GldH|nr:gliding motility lipoprotein GldH [Bacteroidales bacterium]
MTKNKISNITIISLFTLILFSCNSDEVYENYKKIPNQTWKSSGALNFDVNIQDTINTHNIYINVRNSANYNMSNLYLFITTTSPENYTLCDTFQCILADEKGKWLGNGWGDLYENKILYKQNIRFPISGGYNFEFVQGMRTDKLKHISDIGLSIEKSNIK